MSGYRQASAETEASATVSVVASVGPLPAVQLATAHKETTNTEGITSFDVRRIAHLEGPVTAKLPLWPNALGTARRITRDAPQTRRVLTATLRSWGKGRRLAHTPALDASPEECLLRQ